MSHVEERGSSVRVLRALRGTAQVVVKCRQATQQCPSLGKSALKKQRSDCGGQKPDRSAVIAEGGSGGTRGREGEEIMTFQR